LEKGIGGQNGTPPIDEPAALGGGCIGDASFEDYSLLDPPERFEVGVQNYAGQIASGEAVIYLQKIGMDKITRMNAKYFWKRSIVFF
jgi:cysteine desulfurase/selenocysteine lyase